MSAHVLVCGRETSRALCELLESGGCTVSLAGANAGLADLPAQYAAVVVAAGEDLPAARQMARDLSVRRGHTGTLVAVLLPPGCRSLAASLLEEGADEAADSPAELATRLLARLSAADTRREAFETLLAVALSVGGGVDLEACARSILTGLRRSLPGSQPQLHVAASVGEGEHDLVFRLLGNDLERKIQPPTEEARLAMSSRGPVVLGQGGLPAPEPLARRLARHGATTALVLPLVGTGECVGALSILLPRPPTTREQALARAVAGLSANAVAVSLMHARAQRQRAGLETAYLDRYRELLETNRRLRELDHVKDELLALCAHDLRAPLGATLGQARLLAQGSLGPLAPQATQAVDAIRQQAERMLEVITELVDARGRDGPEGPLKRAPNDLVRLVAEECGERQAEARERGIALSATLPEDPVVLPLDASRFRDVLRALLADCLRFTPSGGRIDVAVARQPDGIVEIRVRDSGLAIAPDDLPRLFDRAAARDLALKGRAGGSGLAMAREIVELHGGTLSAHSEGARGAEFVVELSDSFTGEFARPGPERRALVLVAEDDADTRDVVRELLAPTYDVVLAPDGEQAVRLARERTPDLVVMDLFLPRLDGFAAMEDLHRDPRTADVPVIILSAQADDATKVRGLDLGAADYLAKPVSGRELLARVERTLRMVRQREALRALAQTDGLTGLHNFRAFKERLDEELRRSQRYRTPLACVMVDLDGLKAINDRLGHAQGDRAIAAVAQALRSELRDTDFAARYGGDEFVALLPHTSAEDGALFAERVRRRVAGEQLAAGNESLALHASFGVAAVDGTEDERGEELWRVADEALYAAKHGGKNRVERAPARARVEAELEPGAGGLPH